MPKSSSCQKQTIVKRRITNSLGDYIAVVQIEDC